MNISDSEYEVMRILWSQNELTMREIIDRVQCSFDWSESTIKTLIQRLVNKDYLHKNISQRPFIFSTQITERDAQTMRLNSVFDDVCATEHGQLMTYLLNQYRFTTQDIQKMQDQLTQKQLDAPESIECDCLPYQCTCHLNNEEDSK